MNDKSDNKQKLSWIRAYVVAGHIAWTIITPLVVFIGGGSWLINKFNLDYRWIIVFVLLALTMMVMGVWSFVKQLLNMYDDLRSGKLHKLDGRDYDYYDTNYKLKKKSVKNEE